MNCNRKIVQLHVTWMYSSETTVKVHPNKPSFEGAVSVHPPDKLKLFNFSKSSFKNPASLNQFWFFLMIWSRGQDLFWNLIVWTKMGLAFVAKRCFTSVEIFSPELKTQGFSVMNSMGFCLKLSQFFSVSFKSLQIYRNENQFQN